MSAGLVVPGEAFADPFVPVADYQVLERLPAGRTQPWVRELREQRARLAADPENLELALALAWRYVEVGRSEGDPRYYGYAQAALAPWWREPPPGVLLLRATLRQNGHDFEGALDDLDQLLRLEPRNAQAWLTRAVVLQVQGDFDRAYESCRPLRRSRPLLAATCMASVAGLSGDAAPSYEALLALVSRLPTADREERLWAWTVLAEIAVRLDRPEAAEEHFRRALTLDERDLYLLGAYADFLLDRGRPEEVKQLLNGESRSDALLVRLAIAERLLGSRRYLDHVDVLHARFAGSRMRGGELHLGSEALFHLRLLDDPGTALRLALENWEVQREPSDARLVLEAALAAGRTHAARAVVDWLSDSGLEDARLTDFRERIERRKWRASR